MRALWKETVIAQSDDTVVVDGNHYFPRDALNGDHFIASDATSLCVWKGKASYFSIQVDGEVNRDAAWYYPEPKTAAEHIKGRVAFWRGVRVIS